MSSRWGALWRRLVAIDLRSLALFRIALALVVLADLAIRFPDREALLGQGGVLSRAARLDLFGAAFAWSAWDLVAGDPALVTAAFALSALGALALLAGYRTRVATLVCLVSAHGLFVRMPYVATGGDLLLVGLLFWGLFAPLGARLSVDAARAGARGAVPGARPAAGAGAFALVGQMVMLSVLGGTAKLADPSWRAGDGVYYALTAELYTTGLAEVLLALPPLVTFLGYAVIAFEIGGPLLLLVPRRSEWFRFAFGAGFALMNVAFWLSLRVGIFSWVAVAGSILFVPGAMWDRLGRGPLGRLLARMGAAAARWARRVPGAAGRIRLGLPRWGSAIAFLAFALVLVQNLSAGRQLDQRLLPGAVSRVLTGAGLDQRGWPMFSPTARDHGWFLFPGELAGGRAVDLWEGGAPVDESRPARLSADFPSYRWRKLLFAVKRGEPGPTPLRRLLADWLCRRWNRGHRGAERLIRVQLVYFEEVTRPDYETTPARRVVLHRHRCDPTSRPRSAGGHR